MGRILGIRNFMFKWLTLPFLFVPLLLISLRYHLHVTKCMDLKCTIQWADKCLYLCNPHPPQSIQFITPKYSLMSLCSLLPPKGGRELPIFFLSLSIVLCVLELYINGFTESVFFVVWLFLLSIISASLFLRFIHVVVYVDSFFSLGTFSGEKRLRSLVFAGDQSNFKTRSLHHLRGPQAPSRIVEGASP